MSNLMAVLLQTLSARSASSPGAIWRRRAAIIINPVVRWVLFILCEIAIAACDLAEVLGTAIGAAPAQFGFPSSAGRSDHGADVLLLLLLQRLRHPQDGGVHPHAGRDHRRRASSSR
jgi:manganese transport protein